jgi:hypothetical protein
VTQQQYDNHYGYFYQDDEGNRKKYGIYSPGLDRFLHVSDQDMWISLETANIISSKIPTLVYVLSPDCSEIDNNNCLNYSLFNKSTQRVGTSNILVAKQNPTLKMLYPGDKIVNEGPHVDFINNQEILTNLKIYVDYVYSQSMAINISEVFYNPFNSKGFISSYIPNGTEDKVTSTTDYNDANLFLLLRNALYRSNSPEEANAEIISVWRKNFADVGFMIEGYYKILNLPVPEELSDVRGIKSFRNQSSWIF